MPWESEKQLLRALYRKRAKHYDITANFYYLFGFREFAYRKKAVAALGLSAGDTVVEIGCGTGLNLCYLQKQVGPRGRIIGVDMTDEMLRRAQRRIQNKGWTNVELIQTDAAEYEFPEGVQGILSTFAITLIPEYDQIIRKGAEALRPGGRWVVLDLKLPPRWPRWLVRAGVAVSRPFGVTLDLAERHPWESLATYLPRYQQMELYGGLAYIAAGEK